MGTFLQDLARQGSRTSSSRKPKKQSGGDGGILGGLIGGIRDFGNSVVPDLGLGNAAAGAVGIVPGLWHLGSDWATHGLMHNDWKTYPTFAKGLLESGANTASTLAKPLGVPGTRFGLSDLFENSVKGVTGYKPRDILERSRDRNVGILPALIEDVGNVALAGGAASKVMKAGDVGALAGEQVAKEAALEAPGSVSKLKAAAKAESRLEKLPGAAERVPAEAVAARADALRKAEMVAHPYQSVFNKAIRPLTAKAEVASQVGAAAEGVTTAEYADQLKEARRTIAAADAGTSTVTPEEARAHYMEVKQKADAAAVDASRTRTAEQARAQMGVPPENLGAYAAENPDLNLTPERITHDPNPDPSIIDRAAEDYNSPNYHRPNDPEVKAQYEGGTAEHPVGFLEQTKRQFLRLTQKDGVRVDFVGPEHEYRDNADMRTDLEQNGHLNVRSTEMSGDQPNAYMQQVDPETGLSYNDMFRAVHDAYGHAYGNDFSRNGELTAFRSHSQWYTPDVQGALGNESLGQNAAMTKLPPGQFPEQKIGLTDPAVLEHAKTGVDPEALKIVHSSDTQPLDPITVEARNGSTITAEQAMRSPAQMTIEAAHRARLAQAPGWTDALIARLPQGVVNTLANVEHWIQAHEVNVVARERARVVEMARRKAINDPAVQLAIANVIKPLLNKTLDDGTVITPQIAEDLVGGEIMARLTGVQIVATATQAGGGVIDPVIEEAVAQIAMQGRIIPGSLIQELGLDEPLNAAVNEWKRMTDERVATLLGSRLGAQGLDQLGEDFPTMSKAETKKWAQLQRLMKERELWEGRAKGQIARAEKEIEKINHTITKVIDAAANDQKAATEAAQNVRHLYEQHPFGDNEQLKTQALADLADSTMGDSGGGTLDTVSGQLVTSASYAVALRPGTLRTVSAEEFAARGPEILREVMDSDPIFRDGRVRLGTERVTVDGAEVVRIDPSIDSWSADPSVATSMYRPLSKQQSILIAKALGQDQVWDFKAGASIPTKVDPRVQNLTSHFVDLSLSRGSQFKRWTEYLDQFYRDHVRAAEEAGRAPDLHPDDVAAQIQMDMVAAYGWAIAHKKVSPDGIPTKAGLDEYFKHKTIEFSAAKNPRTRYPGDFEGHQLNQVMLNLDIQDPAVHEWIKKTTPDYEEKVAWYDRSHVGIEKHFRGKEVTLGDGSVIDAADLMYQLIAVTSIQTTPQTNLGFALSSFNNWKEFRNGQGAMHKQFARNINKFLKLPADARTNEALINTIMEGVPHGERTGSELAQGMGRSSGIFARKGDHLKAITSILSGHTLDKWNADTVANLNVPWGGKSKGEVQKMLDAIPPDVWEQAKQENAAFPGASVEQRAMALHYGSSAWGKILSFWQNLADPANSRAVTLDVWMARAFGMQSWDKVGDYAEFTRRVTQAADAAGISPHALQALIWAHAKEEITRQGTQRAFGATSQARDILDQGGRLGAENDPVLQQFDYEVSRDAEWQKEKAAAAASGGPAPKKGRIDKITATTAPTHGGPVGTEEMLYQRPTAGQDIAQVEKSRQLYLDTAKKVNTLMDEGKTVEAQHELAKWATRYAKAEKAGEDASDFLHKLDNPTGGVETQIKRGQMLDLADLTADGKFAEDIVAKVLGFTRVTDNAQRMLIRLFQGGDVETLVHENLHVLRQILTPEDIRTVENAIGAPGVFSTKLTDKAGMVRRTQAEELFVREFLGHLYSGQAPSPALQPIFDRLNNGLRDRHTIGDRYGNLTVLDPGALDSVWDKYLDPALPEQRLASGLDRMGQESARISDPTLSPEQLTAQNTPLPGETAGGAVRRQRAMSRALERKHMLEARASDRLKRVARLQKAKSDMERTLTDHATPAEQQVEKISRLIGKVGDKLEASMLDPKTSQVPPVWQPLKQTMDALWKEAENDPVLAQHMEGLPKTFGDILQLAAQKGFDPTHVRSFTPNQVERLVHETIRLGAPGKSAGEEIIAGTRKPRVSGNPRTQSLDALVAATIEATHETQSNELVTFIEKNYSIPYNGAIPHGYEAWDPIKRTFVNRREILPSGINKTQSPEPTMLIPSAVARTLRHMTKDFSHSAFKFLGKPSSWWRTYLLTLTPRWYVNNFVGNFALAEAEGVNMKDWLSALKSYRQRDGKTFGLRAPRGNVPFNDMPGVTGASVYHELENTTLTPPSPGVRGLVSDVKNTPGINARWLRIKHSLARGNEVVDEIARAAVYHHTVRTTGSAEMALQRSYAALVDYGDLGPFERSIVRSIVPFYAWQKGILKVVVRLGIEHPGAFALMQRLSDLQEEKLQDQYGVKLPPGYQGLMDIPGIGTVNTRGMNPFADAGQLVRSGGIGESINPFVESLVRNELNAPQTTRPEDYRLNQFGTMVPETNIPQDITETFSSGLPQGQLIGNLTGNSPYAVPPSTAQSLERFGGLNALSKADLARIVARMTANDATLNGTKVARKARKKSDFLKPFLDLTNK